MTESHVIRRPVIIDADPGVDDVLAILLLLADPSIRILAIITSMGNTSAENGYQNTVKLFVNLVRHIRAVPKAASHWPHLFDDRIILMRGATKPRGGEQISASYFHGDDGCSNIHTTHPQLTPSQQEADDLFETGVLDYPSQEDAPAQIISLLAKYPPRSIGFLTIGPLTTLAATLALDRELFLKRCGLIVTMGGALNVAGNTTATAEFNIRADAYAFHECLRGGLGDTDANPDYSPRWLLVPLDLTNRHTLPFTQYAARVDRYYGLDRPPAALREPLVDYMTPILVRLEKVCNSFGLEEVELHDPTAAWCMTCLLGSEGDAGWQTERRLFDVERKGELTTGMLVVDRRSSAKNEKGKNRFDSQSASSHVPMHGGPPPVQLNPIEMEVVTESPGLDILREKLIRAFGPMSSSVPVRR